MTQTLGKYPRTWLPSFLLIISMTAASWAQETPRHYDALVHEVISKLDEFVAVNGGSEKYSKGLPELQRLQFKIKQYQTLAKIELHQAEELQNATVEYLKVATAELEMLDAEAIKSQGMRIQSAETIDFLVRNCLIEQQRLQLDSITARKLLEKKSKPIQEIDAERLRIEAEELAVRGMMEKLRALKKLYEAKQVDDQTLLDLENEIAVRTVKSRAMMAEYEQKKESLKSSSEDQIKDIQLRQEMLTTQLDRLAKQQEWTTKAKHLNANIEAASKRIREAEAAVFKSVAKLREMEALNTIINNIVDDKKKKE